MDGSFPIRIKWTDRCAAFLIFWAIFNFGCKAINSFCIPPTWAAVSKIFVKPFWYRSRLPATIGIERNWFKKNKRVKKILNKFPPKKFSWNFPKNSHQIFRVTWLPLKRFWVRFLTSFWLYNRTPVLFPWAILVSYYIILLYNSSFKKTIIK